MPLYKMQFNRKRKHSRTAWRIFIPARKFNQPEPKTMHKPTNRLVAHAYPPGGFWAEPRNAKNSTYQMKDSYTYDYIKHNMMNTMKTSKHNSPYRDSLLEIRIFVLLSNPIPSVPLFSLPQCFTLNFLAPHNPNFSGKAMPNSHTKMAVLPSLSRLTHP